MKAQVFVLVYLALAAAANEENDSDLVLAINGALKKLLHLYRPNMANLSLPLIPITINTREANITASIKNGRLHNLENFVVKKMTTGLFPPELKNATITLDALTMIGDYEVNGTVGEPADGFELVVNGKGRCKVVLQGIFFTIATRLTLHGFKPQVPKDGFYGFDVYLTKSKVELYPTQRNPGSRMFSVINNVLTDYLPILVGRHKHQFFEVYKEPIRIGVNKVLGSLRYDIYDLVNEEIATLHESG